MTHAVMQYTVPGQPTNVQRLCTVVVWQAPLQPNGQIVGYDLEFLNSGQSNIRSLDTGVNFYITSISERATGTDVRVSLICTLRYQISVCVCDLVF